MINIAICDDDKGLTGIVEQLLLKIAAERCIEISCDVFFDGSSLVRAITEQRLGFDLIYLDIEMEHMNGINAAQILREMELPTLIIYLSGHEQYMKELFRTEPFCFLDKPIEEKLFRETFISACNRLQKRAGYFTFSFNKVFYKIPLNQIMYFESYGRVITIYTPLPKSEESNELQNIFYGKLNDVEKQISLMNGRFLRVHQSYLVNFDYIKAFAPAHVVILDGRKLQISEDRRKDVYGKLHALLGEEGYENE